MQQILRAGPLKMTYQDGEIRGLVLEAEQTEIVRRIYSAVRDRNWGTVPARITCEEIEDGGDHFRVSFEANHSQDDIEFEWHGEIRGTAEGTLLFEFDGEARTTFERSRIGFCVLHPIRECVGAAVRIEHEDCSVEETCFPREIAPHEPFQAFKALSHQVAGNLWTRIAFEGEVFETEDQRNWIDASFKTFGTSLSLPYPVKIEAGMRVRQTVTVELIGQSTRHQTVQNSMPAVTVQITAGERTEKKLPPIGLGAASTVLSPTEVAALQTLSLNHLRIELNLKSDFEDALRSVAAEAQKLDCALEIAVFVGKESAAQTPRTTARLLLLAELLDKLQTPVHAFLIFADNVRVAPRGDLEEARRVLGRFAPVGNGSNANFAEFNRQPMEDETLDLVTFAANPQVHAFDDQSVMETLEAVPHVVHSARVLYPGKSIFLSPLTLKPRFNAVAVGPERPLLPGELPPSVDARQKTTFCAAWTLAVLASLVQCGFGESSTEELPTDSLTLFETTGPRGLMEENGVFPIFDLLGQIAPLLGESVFLTTSSDTRRAVGLCFETAIFVANLGAERLLVTVEGHRDTLFEPYETKKFEREIPLQGNGTPV